MKIPPERQLESRNIESLHKHFCLKSNVQETGRPKLMALAKFNHVKRS